MKKYLQIVTKHQWATAIALLFHTIGIVGLLFFDKSFFIASTPLNLLLMFILLIWTQKEKNTSFFILLFITAVTGILVEIIGVNTGWLFGNYQYGKALGIGLKGVPLMIGINWFIIIYCCGISTQTLLLKVIRKVNSESGEPPLFLKSLSVIIDGATLAVVFDWIMEPVAVKLGYWQWLGDGSIPLYNYFCWFIVSVIILCCIHLLELN